MKKLFRIGLVVLAAVSGGWASMRLAGSGVRWGVDPADALCFVELAPGQARKSVDFVLRVPLDSFKILVVPRTRRDLFRLSMTSGDTPVFSATISDGAFGGGRDVPPGTYTLVVEQDPGGSGGSIYVSERALGLSGWQLYSRAFVALVLLSAVWAWSARRSSSVKHRQLSRVTFHYLLLGALLVFTYLLFHEGGHALLAILFGNFSWAHSDFWGLSGHPHSGLKPSADVVPWQRALVSFAGPAVPTLVGWALFAVWVSSRGTRLRRNRPTLNLYCTALVFMCVLPAAVVLPAQLLGFASDGDWRGFINNVPGRLWLVKTVLWTASVFNLAVVVRVAVELRQVWRTHLSGLTKAAE